VARGRIAPAAYISLRQGYELRLTQVGPNAIGLAAQPLAVRGQDNS